MKKLSQNILLAAAAAILVLITAEVVMRFAWEMGGWVRRPIYRKSPDPYLRYELVPGSSAREVVVNSAGFRGRECPREKPAGVFRILMLGDSETLSYMIPLEESLPAQLEKTLSESDGSRRFEVLNFGVEGYNTLQELQQLKTKGLQYNPDLIILNYCLNDPEPGEYYFNKTFLMRHSALVRYFTYRFKKAAIKRERKRLNIRSEPEHYAYLHSPKFFPRVKGALLEMADIAKSRGNKLVVVVFPTSSLAVKDFRENYPYRQLHALLKAVDSDKIVFIDLIEEFNRLGLTPEDVSISYKDNESHKNALALKVSADYIGKILKENRLIP